MNFKYIVRNINTPTLEARFDSADQVAMFMWGRSAADWLILYETSLGNMPQGSICDVRKWVGERKQILTNVLRDPVEGGS